MTRRAGTVRESRLMSSHQATTQSSHGSRDGDYADPHIGGMATDHDATARAARSSQRALRTLEWMEAPTQRRQRSAAKRRLALSEPIHRRTTDRPAGGRLKLLISAVQGEANSWSFEQRNDQNVCGSSP